MNSEDKKSRLKLRDFGCDIEPGSEDCRLGWENKCAFVLRAAGGLARMLKGLELLLGGEPMSSLVQAAGYEDAEADYEIIGMYPRFEEGFAALAAAVSKEGWGQWSIVSIDSQVHAPAQMDRGFRPNWTVDSGAIGPRIPAEMDRRFRPIGPDSSSV